MLVKTFVYLAILAFVLYVLQQLVLQANVVSVAVPKMLGLQ